MDNEIKSVHQCKWNDHKNRKYAIQISWLLSANNHNNGNTNSGNNPLVLNKYYHNNTKHWQK